MVSRAMGLSFEASRSQAEASVSRHRLHQRRYLDRRKVGEGVRYRVWQDDLITVPHGSAGIDHIGNVSLALGRLGPQQRFARSRQHFGWVVFVKQRRAD